MTPEGRGILAVTSVMTFLSTVFVLLRFLARRKTSVKWDDWVCVAALVTSYGFLAASVCLVTIGHAGYDIYTKNSMQTISIFAQSYLAADIMATAGLSLTKISILLSYRRIFAISRGFRIATWIISFLVFGYFVSTSCGLIFPTKPVEADWKPWIPHTHINYRAFWISFGVTNMALDIGILCLPQPLVWRLQMSTRRKIQLTLLFLLGAFVCVASIIRLSIVIKADFNDLARSLLPGANWNAVEMNTGIICTCLPMMPALVRDKLIRTEMNSGTTAVSNESDAYRREWARKLEQMQSSSDEVQLIEREASKSSSAV